MNEQLMLQQVMQLVLAVQLGDPLAQQTLLQIMLAALAGDPLALQIAKMILSIMQSAKFGAKLNYLKFLKGKCPEGYEMLTFKTGGNIECNRCIKKNSEGDKMPLDPISAFKCGRKMKKKASGGEVKKEACGGKNKLIKKK